MNTPVAASSSWSTASFGHSADTSPMELSALGEHLDLCKGLSGRMFHMRCRAEAMHGFVVTRFVTTLAVLSALIGVACLVT